MALYEETIFWGYSAYRYGELIGTGSNPIPQEILEQATEIQWLNEEPAVEE